jgi:hypothetical protein
VLRKTFRDRGAHQLLGATVGDGHGRLIGFRFDGELAMGEERANERAGVHGEFDHQRAVAIQIHDQGLGTRD